MLRFPAKAGPNECEVPRTLRQDGTGTPGPFDRSHGSELVEELHGRTVASRMRAEKFSLTLCLLTPPVPLRRDGAVAAQSPNPKFL